MTHTIIPETDCLQALEQALKPLNSARELAKLSGLGESTLSEWRTQHVGPAFVKIGRRVFYPKETVLDYMRAHLTPTSDHNERTLV